MEGRRWLPPLTRASTWLVVPGLIGGWFSGTDEDEQTETTTEPRPAPVPRDRLVTAERIGLYNVELDGSAQGAINVHGQPLRSTPDSRTCGVEWRGAWR